MDAAIIYIQEKTQNYKELICDKEEYISTIRSDETVLFSNGHTGKLQIEIWYSNKCEYLLRVVEIHITNQNNEEIQDYSYTRRILSLIRLDFFDVSVFDNFGFTLQKSHVQQHDVDALSYIAPEPLFYNPDYYIQERTEKYKEYVIDIIWAERYYSDITKEIVLFNNGVKVSFGFDVMAGQGGYSIDPHIWYSYMHITLDGVKVRDPIVIESVKKIIEHFYFDSFTGEILDVVGSHHDV
jgi:hypothetical protein